MTDHTINPWHSRPIDVHRWSDHPEVKELVDRIWDGFLGEKIAEKTRGPKPRMEKLGGKLTFAALITSGCYEVFRWINSFSRHHTKSM